MELSDFKKKYTVIFLADTIPPTKLVLLKRGSDRELAPGMFTGLGGHIGDKEEFKDETALESANRELLEEAGLSGIDLQEFGRLIVNGKILLVYFFGIFHEELLPSCTEGVLEWVPFNDVLSKDIIPTTRFFIEKWSQNGWSLNSQTVFLEREGVDVLNSRTISLEYKEGLHFNL